MALLFLQVPCSAEPLMDSSLVSVGVLKDFAAALCELGIWTLWRISECRIPSPGQRVYVKITNLATRGLKCERL